MLRRTFIAVAIASIWAFAMPSFAGVTADEAAALKTTLTPLGGEKAGNKDGSIPAWDGGLNKAPSGYTSGAPRVNPYASEKPIVQITAQNVDQYKDKLSQGTQEMLRKYPTYRLDIYPTHRTAAAPKWVYDNTFANATRAKTTAGGNSVENAYGGIPFPIPKTGAEVMWNHLLRWRGEAVEVKGGVWVIGSDGKSSLAVKMLETHQYPYYAKDGGLNSFKGDYWLLRQVQTDPPFKAGESILIRDPLDQVGKGRQAWQYLSGQRRVRRAPTLAFDTPDFVASGQNYFDEVFNFLGSIERYEWKIVGKKEFYVPYNNNQAMLSKPEEVIAGHHMNPDKLRWELHRVWVLEANLAAGKRHAVPKKMFYVDEDSWSVLMMDGYDAQGKLWRTQHAVPFVAPDMPAVIAQTSAIFNLQSNNWSLSAFPDGTTSTYKVIDPRPDSFFTPDALAGGGVR